MAPKDQKKSRAPIAVPPTVASAAEAVGKDAFLLPAEHVDAYFVRRSPVLFVTFDNLASVGEYDPPQPWLQIRAAESGFSILGLIAKRKDWYRNDDAPRLLTELRDAGLFDQFDHVVFTGTSMGAYAALTYSRLAPGATVLAFSPQTTLNRDVAPFETRFPYGYRKWDWDSPTYLDAADSVESAGEIWLFYDPFVAEDDAHAKRLQGRAVRHVKCGHFGHRLIRQLKSCGVLDRVFHEIGGRRFNEAAFRKALRSRREIKAWRKEFLGNLAARRHDKLAVRMAEFFLKDDPKARYARRIQLQIESDAPAVEEIVVPGGAAEPTFSGLILKMRGAYVVPERKHDARLASGVLLADRSYCELSRAWIRPRRFTPEPVLAENEPIEKLSGRHLFAGHFRGHFGHFLVESTARLWALSELKSRIDSVLYLPFRGKVKPTQRVMRDHEDFFRLIGVDVPVTTFGTTLEVEELYVPELGFGWNERYAGSPAYRRFMREELGREIAPEGSEKLYVSRARLPSQRGGVLGETVIEINLARLGYEIFHPEKHPIEVQIARYKAAQQIVGLDGSALHLAAFVMPEGGKVGIIKRRSNADVRNYILQYESFCGVTPDTIDVIRREWASGDSTRIDFRSVGELDFAKLFDELAQLGYVESDFRPDLPDQSEVDGWLKEFAERRGDEFATVGEAEED